MPKKKKTKKSDNWQRDCPEKEKKRKSKKKGQRCCPEKKEKKKKNLNWGYFCKVHFLALFPPHFPPKLGG